MDKNIRTVIIVVLFVLLSSCSKPSPAPTAVPTEEPTALPSPIPTATPDLLPKVCLVTDTGGIDDNGLNSGTWQGIQENIDQGIIDGEFIESQSEEAVAQNIQNFIDDGCGLIVTVGATSLTPTVDSARANPDIDFLIVSATSGQSLPNLTEVSFQMEQAAFLAGYLAAGVAIQEAGTGATPKIGTYGGMTYPPIDLMMDAYTRGAQYYNQLNNSAVEVLGWDVNDPSKALYANSFGDQEIGRSLTNDLMDQGAIVIFPVAGMVGVGTAMAIKERGGAYMIGPDVDWYVTQPDYSSVILTSVVSHLDSVVAQVIEDWVNGVEVSGIYYGNLSNDGVGLTEFHDLDALVSVELKTSLDTVKTELISGTIVLGQ